MPENFDILNVIKEAKIEVESFKSVLNNISGDCDKEIEEINKSFKKLKSESKSVYNSVDDLKKELGQEFPKKIDNLIKTLFRLTGSASKTTSILEKMGVSGDYLSARIDSLSKAVEKSGESFSKAGRMVSSFTTKML
jgi:methyl-accepting chemotaxis protein